MDLSRELVAPQSGLDALEATARARIQFRSSDGVRRVEGEAVTAGYFDLLGARPVVGRTFTADEHRVGGPRVMLLDYRTWGERFAFDETITGRTISTDQGEYTVIGVLSRDFTGTVEDDSGEIEFWVPIEQYLSGAQREDRAAGVQVVDQVHQRAGVHVVAVCGDGNVPGGRVETHGQKSFNGVALISKLPLEDVTRGLPGGEGAGRDGVDDEEARYIEATVVGDKAVRICGLYLPNGNPAPGPKYDYKLRWMERLRARALGLGRLLQPRLDVAADEAAHAAGLDVRLLELLLHNFLKQYTIAQAVYRPRSAIHNSHPRPGQSLLPLLPGDPKPFSYLLFFHIRMNEKGESFLSRYGFWIFYGLL